MGHQQTKTHRPGKHSYHQIGLVRGQFGSVPEAQWLDRIAEIGFDGWEEASWELDLASCGDDAGAKAYAEKRVAEAKNRGMEILSLAAHLQGQALGDEPSAKTLQFLGGECVEAYAKWRSAGNEPPRTDPFYVPDDVAEIARKQACDSLVNTVRLAHFIGQLEDRIVPVSGFVGSPAHCWSHWFLFPPLPSSLGGHEIPDVFQVSLELLVERFSPVFQACLKYGTTFNLECHPSERAMGDITSAGDYLAALDAAGFEKAAGFNFDCSHMEWQGVSGVDFIRTYGDRIHCAHIKGVQVAKGYTRNGLLGGHRPMGDKHNGWNFVTAGTARDATNTEELLVELNRAGYSGGVSIEWEDNDVEQMAGAAAALANVHRADQPPSGMRHDEQLKA
ncbi:MAG: sugar phosphate isomerase/epimerase [Planctomycetota bacterium]|nr:MAG: sugar phosphate isomerase/epimerase [Planctomycetota bacterium]